MYQLDQSFTRLSPGIDFSTLCQVPDQSTHGTESEWCILGQPPQPLRALHWPALIQAWHERLVKVLCEPTELKNHRGLRRVQVLGDAIFERDHDQQVHVWVWSFDENDRPQLERLPDTAVAVVGTPYRALWLDNYRRGALRTLLAQHPGQETLCANYIDWAGQSLQNLCWTPEVQTQVRASIAQVLELNPQWLLIADEVTLPDCSREPLRLAHYNHVASYHLAYASLSQEAPQLIALYALLAEELDHSVPPAQAMKLFLKDNAIGAAMWCLLTRYGTGWMLEHLACFALKRITVAKCAVEILQMAKAFGTQQLVPKELLSALMHLCGNPNRPASHFVDQLDDLLGLCKRLGVILAQADEPTRQLLLEQAEPLLAWAEAHVNEIGSRAMRHITLDGLLTRMQLQQKRDEFNAQAHPAWRVPYRVDLQNAAVQAVVLDSALAIWQEGQSMRHCADTYTSMCAKGKLLMLSLRRPGQSHGFATVSFDLRGSTVELHRYSGFANQALQPADMFWIECCKHQVQVQHEAVLAQREARRQAARRKTRPQQAQATPRCTQQAPSEVSPPICDTSKVKVEETATGAAKPSSSEPGVDMKAEICRHGSFHRVVALEPIAAVPGQFALTFGSLLDSSRNPHAERRNFSAVLSQADVQALRDLLDETLKA